MFKYIVAERGNAPGRAWHLSTEYFGQKPPNSEYNNPQPTPPSIEIQRWEKSRRIAWAKADRPVIKSDLVIGSSAVGSFYINPNNPEDIPF